MHTAAVKLLITKQIEFLNRGERDLAERKIGEIAGKNRKSAQPDSINRLGGLL
jgi:hypothetical protein